MIMGLIMIGVVLIFCSVTIIQKLNDIYEELVEINKRNRKKVVDEEN
jgi:hypothetical protein